MQRTTINAVADLFGQDLGYSDWLTVDQQRIDMFADATGDHQWIHTEPDRAKTGPFGTTIAHGYLTLSLVLPLLEELLNITRVSTKVNYGLNTVRFPAPVPAGSRVRLGARITEITEIKNGVQLVVDATVEIEGGTKPACVAQPVLRFYS